MGSRGVRRRHPVAWCLRAGAAPVVASVLAATAPAGAVSEPPATAEWVTPVPGRVIRPFSEPAGSYGPGHRGVDFAAPPGTPVRAAGSGTVTFAGDVAGSLHVVIAHGSGVRTSYSFLADVAVHVAETVGRGTVIGHSGGSDPDDDRHGPDRLHFGLRRGDRYLDPLLLFRARDLTELVRLVPAGDPPDEPWGHPDPAEERALLLRGFGWPAPVPDATGDDGGCGNGIPLVGGAVSAVCDAATWTADHLGAALDAGLGLLAGAGRMGLALAGKLRAPLEALAGRLSTLASAARDALLATPLARVLADLVEMGGRFLAWTRQECSSDAPPADGTGGSGHLLMAVAGIDSSSKGPDARSFGLDARALGYHEDEIHWFSYAEDGGAYTADDTHGDLRGKALLLAEQLIALNRREPGREVDLVAHSQGGVVVDYFFQNVYRASDPAYPPLGTVVTLASPHQGAPLATAGAQIRSTRSGRAVLDALDAAKGDLGPPSSGISTLQLSERSPFIGHLWDHELPDHVEVTSIGGTDDPVVPANAIHVPGGTDVVVAVDGLNDHSNIVHDDRALQAVRTALEHRPPPCTSILEGLRSAIEPVVLSRVAHELGDRITTRLELLDEVIR